MKSSSWRCASGGRELISRKSSSSVITYLCYYFRASSNYVNLALNPLTCPAQQARQTRRKPHGAIKIETQLIRHTRAARERPQRIVSRLDGVRPAGAQSSE